MVESFAPVAPVIGPTRPTRGVSVWVDAGSTITVPENVPSPSAGTEISWSEILTMMAKSLCCGRKSTVFWNLTEPETVRSYPLRAGNG